MKKVVDAIYKAINALAFFSGFLVVCLMLVTVYLVGARYIFSKPPPWAIEISEHMLAFYAFLSAAWLLRKGGHVKLDLVVSRLSPNKQVFLNFATSTMGTIVCLIIFVFSVDTARLYFLENVQTQTVLNFPSFILISVIAISFFFLSAQFIIETCKIYTNFGKKVDKKDETATTVVGGIY